MDKKEQTRKEELVARALTRLKKEQVALSLMELHFPERIWEQVEFLGWNQAYMKNSASLEDMMSLLRGLPYKQDGYHMSGNEWIAVKYGIDKVSLLFYIPATQENLTAISRGKCTLEEYVSTGRASTVSKRINCNLGDS